MAEELRNEQGCDVVVVSAHCGSSDLLASIDVSQYADAVFCAHTHREERFERNGVPFLQGGSNGYNVAHIVSDCGKTAKSPATRTNSCPTITLGPTCTP